VRRRDKEIVEIGECASLAFVIEHLQALSRSLPPDSEPEVIMGGNDYFGWRLTVSFSRELTPEELALEARYSQPHPEMPLPSRAFNRSNWAAARRASGRPPSQLST
jgi:hypothetical protein